MVNLFISGLRDKIKEKAEETFSFIESANPTTLPTSTLDYLTSKDTSTKNEVTTAPDNSAEVNVVLVNPETDEKCSLTCSGLCIDQEQICDGLLDCKLGEDELNCQLRQCENDEFKCVEGNYQEKNINEHDFSFI